MKKKFLLFLITHFLIIRSVSAQPPGEWMWIHGNDVVWTPGSFGVQGVPSPANMPPGLYEACEWTDLNGNFWLFGGVLHTAGEYAALWKYDPVTNQWTWMKGPNTPDYSGSYGTQGVSSPTNNPPSRAWGTPSWVDLQGNLWMGFGFDVGPGAYSDLWKYNISTNEWTWVKGPSTPNVLGTYGIQGVPNPANNPGCRHETAAAWTDNAGDLWLFGGQADTVNFAETLNDLWRFNIATNTWTWMKGASTINDPGFYGIPNVEYPLNNPPSRMSYSHWKGNDGKFWLFGGWGTTANYNDMWRFDIATNNWTWIGGNFLSGDSGTFGTRCVTASSNLPPDDEIENRAAWKDQNGNFWFFGGGSIAGTRNNVWLYCVATNQWTWISGDTVLNTPGNWGVINVPSPSNKPPGRMGALAWLDNNGHVYIFGGLTSPPGATINALWRYTFDTSCYSCQVQQLLTSLSQDSSVCAGSCTNISTTTSGGNPPYAYSWNPSVGTGSGPHQVCPAVTTTYSVLVTDSSGNTVSDSVTVIVNPLPQIIISSDTTISAGNSALLTATGGGSYHWSTGQTSSSISVSPTSDTEYCVVVTDSNQCSDTACAKVFVIGEAPCPTNKDLSVPNAFSPNHDGHNDVFCLQGWNVCIKDFIVHIYDRWGEEVFQSTNSEFCWDGTYKGKPMDAAVFVYYIKATLTTSEEILREGNISLIR